MSTESDRELLELAAKANGLPWKWVKCPAYKIEVPGLLYRDEAHEVDYYPGWNPLENDGDALRLSVKLCLSIDHNHPADQQRWVAADRSGCEGCYGPVSCVEDFEDDSNRSAATRRAIVRAAAEIARATHKEGA